MRPNTIQTTAFAVAIHLTGLWLAVAPSAPLVLLFILMFAFLIVSGNYEKAIAVERNMAAWAPVLEVPRDFAVEHLELWREVSYEEETYLSAETLAARIEGDLCGQMADLVFEKFKGAIETHGSVHPIRGPQKCFRLNIEFVKPNVYGKGEN